MVHEVEVPTHELVKPPEVANAVYPAIELPPSSAGAFHEIVRS